MFGRLFRLEKKSAPSQSDADLLALLSSSGVLGDASVTPQRALQYAPVACAVRTIAEAVGQLPAHVYQRGADGARERDSLHPASRLVHDEANAWTSAQEFRTQITVDALLHGNGFGFVNRVNSRPAELIRLEPQTVSATIDQTTREPIYRIAGEIVPREKVLHVRCSLSTDGLNGLSPVKLASKAIHFGLTLEAIGTRFFLRSAQPGGILSAKEKLSPEAIERAIKIFNAQTQGADNAGKTILMPSQFEYARSGLSNVDSQYLELRKHAVEEIARAFRVPPHLLFEMGEATWGNASELKSTFVELGLMPWIKSWESAYRRALFSDDERVTYFPEFVVDDLLRADFSKRAEGLSKLVAAEIITRNEARAIGFNLKPIDGADTLQNPNTSSAHAPRLREAA